MNFSRVTRCFSLPQLKLVDGEKEQKEREAAELQTRLLLEEQREEEKARELFTVRHKLTEAETARDFLKKEVRVHLQPKGTFGLCCRAGVKSRPSDFSCP